MEYDDDELESKICDDIFSDIMEYLRGLQVAMVEGFKWLRNPFMFSRTEQRLSTKQYEKLTDISIDTG
jgi:hypothetical protein